MIPALLIAAATLGGWNAPGDPAVPAPTPTLVDAVIDYAPTVCNYTDAYLAIGITPDVDGSVAIFEQFNAGDPDLVEATILYRGIIIGCIAAGREP